MEGMRGPRAAAVAGCSLIAALLVAACGSTTTVTVTPSPAATPASSTSSSSASSSSASSSSTSSSSSASSSTASSTSSTPGQPPTCPTGQLQIAVVETQGATGHIETVLGIRNTGTTDCTLTGYPGIEFHNAGGALPTNPNHATSTFFGTAAPPSLITLTPGTPPLPAPGQSPPTSQPGQAYIDLGNVDNCAGGAAPTSFTAIYVIPPNDVSQVPVAVDGAECDGQIDVSPVETQAGWQQH